MWEFDPGLAEQYYIEVGGDSAFVPEITDGLFLCTCGALNMASDKTCNKCHRSAERLFSALDETSLTQKREVRLQREAEEKAERRLAAEDYDGSVAAFDALGDYKDSAARIDEVRYAKNEPFYIIFILL